MRIDIEKDGNVQSVKKRYLQNFLDKGWKLAKSKKTTPAAKKIEAAAEVKPVEEDWDIFSGEDWADSEESVSEDKNEGEA